MRFQDLELTGLLIKYYSWNRFLFSILFFTSWNSFLYQILSFLSSFSFLILKDLNSLLSSSTTYQQDIREMRRRQRWGSQFSPALGNIFIFEDSFLSQELIYDLILFHFLSDFISLVGTSRESYLKMSRHGGAIRILSKEILGFKTLLSLASHKS